MLKFSLYLIISAMLVYPPKSLSPSRIFYTFTSVTFVTKSRLEGKCHTTVGISARVSVANQIRGVQRVGKGKMGPSSDNREGD